MWRNKSKETAIHIFSLKKKYIKHGQENIIH